MEDITLTAETQTALEHEIIKHNAKGFSPVGNVLKIGKEYQIKMVKDGARI